MTKRFTIALITIAMFVLLAVMPVSAYVVAQNVSQGATVFIGESGLNITPAQLTAQAAGGTNSNVIGWWASAASISASAPTKTIDLTGRNLSFTVAPTDFVGYTGNWYLYNGSTSNQAFIFTVADPSLAIAPWDFALGSSGTDVSGKSVVQGQKLAFKVDTNMYSAINNRNLRFPVAASDGITAGGTTFGIINDGYLDIKVKDPSGVTLTSLMNASGATPGTSATSMPYALAVSQQNVSVQPWYWGTAASTLNPYAPTRASSSWATDALDRNGQYYYPPGTYTIYAESALNGMKDNYKNAGADYTGKTISSTTTITLVSDSLKIEANKDSVVRSKPFTVTITGKPSTKYHIWVKGTNSMTGGYDDQPPMITQFQSSVVQDTDSKQFANSPGLAGNYTYQNGAGKTIWQNVAYPPSASYKAGDAGYDRLANGTYLYANISTGSGGTRIVQWETTNWTKAQKYTIRVEQQFVNGVANNAAPNFAATAGTYYSDEVDVNVEKGAVTIVAAGDQSYYLGEEIKFSGTNTETYNTYLFIMGPNLKPAGSKINVANPRSAEVQNGVVADFQTASVLGDNTWSWKWGTSNIALDAGTYTIYAVSQPSNYANLQDAAFGTVSIIIKKPFVSATASQSTVAQGDEVFITGTAEGNPIGVKVWILGKNYPTSASDVKTQSVNADASFKYEIAKTSTKNLYPGQYFVVVQHPMQNNVFDVTTVADTTDSSIVYVKNLQLNAAGEAGIGTNIFTLLGAGSLQGSDAAEALVQGINSPNVDDTYTKLQFLVEVPVIRIDPVGEKHVGDKFTITAATNLAVDDEVLVQVYSSSFKPTQKSQSGEFSGATGTVKVAKGDSGMNKLSFDVDSSTFKPDEYIVTADAILQVATGTALFNVLEGAAPVVTTAVPVSTTAVATAVPTAVATEVPTPIPTTKSPGYGALIALIGLGAVAFIVVRRH